MRANCWIGKEKVSVETVPDPKILSQSDVFVKITPTAICGSDLHLYNGFVPSMESGDVLGHEFMGEVVEVGRGVKNLKKGDRVVVPFPIACGSCFMCEKQLFSVCENTNPIAWTAEKCGDTRSQGFSATRILREDMPVVRLSMQEHRLQMLIR